MNSDKPNSPNCTEDHVQVLPAPVRDTSFNNAEEKATMPERVQAFVPRTVQALIPKRIKSDGNKQNA